MSQALLEERERYGAQSTATGTSVAGKEACGYELDTERGVLAVHDRDQETTYTLGPKPGGGYGWIAAYGEPQGTVLQTWKLSAAEPMAVVRELGGEDEVAGLTLAAADRLSAAGGYGGRRAAGRLRGEVAAGRNLEVMAVRPVQAAVLRCLIEDGLSVSDLCRRGGFLNRFGDPDVSWLERRAGLKPEVCGRTGRRLRRRVVGYEIYARLVEAVGGDPIDFGV